MKTRILKFYDPFSLFSLALLAVPLLILSACKEEIPKASGGGVDLLFSVYFQASKGLENSKTYHRSSLSFLPQGLFEIAPLELGESDKMAYYLIKDSLYYELDKQGKPLELKQGRALRKKSLGAPFSTGCPVGYGLRKELQDTLLFKKRYRRFEISTPEQYSRYYILKSDSLLPYSLYPILEKDYEGRLERIDYYDVKGDVFYSLQWVRRYKRSVEAESYLAEGRFLRELTP